MAIGRRGFLDRSVKGGFGAVLGVAAMRTSLRAVAPSDKVVVGIMGVGRRGAYLTELFAQRPDVEIAYVCDVDDKKTALAAKAVQGMKGKAPAAEGSFEHILEDSQVDALVCAAPDHWHSLATVLACQVGKDVYVESPASHNIWEGRKMVEAARKYNRVVQVGMQDRSASYAATARQLIQSGKLGTIHLVSICNMMSRARLENTPDSLPPEGFDWAMWLGPAEKRPYNTKYFQWVYWDFSGGNITEEGVHQLDLARWVIGASYPKFVHHTGGNFFFKDGAETPDTSLVTYAYDGLALNFQQAWWTPYMTKFPENVRESMTTFPDWYPSSGTRTEIYGSDGMMILGRDGGGWQQFDREGRKVTSDKQTFAAIEAAHIDNFINCIRSRKRPSADVEDGHVSAALCHMANISYRLGDRKLAFDSASETFAGDDEANHYLRRSYREPWAIPENV